MHAYKSVYLYLWLQRSLRSCNTVLRTRNPKCILPAFCIIKKCSCMMRIYCIELRFIIHTVHMLSASLSGFLPHQLRNQHIFLHVPQLCGGGQITFSHLADAFIQTRSNHNQWYASAEMSLTEGFYMRNRIEIESGTLVSLLHKGQRQKMVQA